VIPHGEVSVENVPIKMEENGRATPKAGGWPKVFAILEALIFPQTKTGDAPFLGYFFWTRKRSTAGAAGTVTNKNTVL